MWVLDLDEDVESDFSRFHQIWMDIDQDDFGGLSAERLFSLATRLGAYEGAVAARIYHLREEEKSQHPSRATIEQPGTVVTDDLAVLMADPAMGQYIQVEQV
jgi:hypothetical protein